MNTKTYNLADHCAQKTIHFCGTINQHWLLLTDYKFLKLIYILFLLERVWAAFALYFNWIVFFCRASSASGASGASSASSASIAIDELRLTAVDHLSCLLVVIPVCIFVILL